MNGTALNIVKSMKCGGVSVTFLLYNLLGIGRRIGHRPMRLRRTGVKLNALDKRRREDQLAEVRLRGVVDVG